MLRHARVRAKSEITQLFLLALPRVVFRGEQVTAVDREVPTCCRGPNAVGQAPSWAEWVTRHGNRLRAFPWGVSAGVEAYRVHQLREQGDLHEPGCSLGL